MEIKEFKEAKAKLERDIASEVQGLIAEFEEDTGYTPHNVSIYMINVGSMVNPKQCMVSGASVDIDL